MRKIREVVLAYTSDEGVIMTDVGTYNTDMVLVSELPVNLRTHDRPHNHLYIISTEDIVKGEWCLHRVQHEYNLTQAWEDNPMECYKILATTKSLAECDECKKSKEGDVYSCKSNVFPKIPAQFIEEFAKSQGSIKEVQVEYGSTKPETHLLNEIIIYTTGEKRYTRNDMIDFAKHVWYNKDLKDTSTGLLNYFDEWVETKDIN